MYPTLLDFDASKLLALPNLGSAAGTMFAPASLPSLSYQRTFPDDDARSTTASQSSQDVPVNVKTTSTADSADKKAHKIRSQFFKTQLCRFHRKGYCRNADNCAFAHGNGNVASHPDLTKTSLCSRWMKGECPLQSHECGFAHGHDELRVTETFNKTSMCSMFMRGGSCPQGDKCRHAHSEQELSHFKAKEHNVVVAPQSNQNYMATGTPGFYEPGPYEPYHIPLLDMCEQYDLGADPYSATAPADDREVQSPGRTVYPVKGAAGVCWLAVQTP